MKDLNSGEVLFVQYALPDDPDLDDFDSGVEEVNRYFRSREWFNTLKGKYSPPTYQFRAQEEGKVIGYAAVVFKNQPHPQDNAITKSKYLVIYVAGLYARFHGVKNPRAPEETYATSMFRVLEQFARDKEDCVGLSLWVREDNVRAIHFYRKYGFVEDPGGPVDRAQDGSARHITMRKPISRS